MKRLFRNRGLLATTALACTLVSAPVLSQKVATGTAQGELKGMSRTFPLRFAYAMAIDDVEGIRSRGKGKKSIVLELTDVELPPDAVGSWSRCDDLARDGKLNGVEIQMDAATGKVYGGEVYYAITQGKPTGHRIHFSSFPPPFDSDYNFKNLKIGPDTISGIAMTTTQTSSSTADKDGFEFYYKAQFNATLAHQPPVTAILTGRAVRSSPQVQVMLAFEAACRKGDMEAVKRMTTPASNKEADAEIAQMGQDKFLSLLQVMSPDRKTLFKQSTRVVVRGMQATVIYNDAADVSSTSLTNTNGVWLLGKP